MQDGHLMESTRGLVQPAATCDLAAGPSRGAALVPASQWLPAAPSAHGPDPDNSLVTIVQPAAWHEACSQSMQGYLEGVQDMACKALALGWCMRPEQG